MINNIPKPRGIEKPGKIDLNNLSNKMEKIMAELPDNYGVENFVKVVNFGGSAFDGIYEALQDDGKISLTEGISIGVSLLPQMLGLISGITEIPKEVLYDMISEQDLDEISTALDDIEHLKGDTRDGARDLLKIIFGLKDWYFKYFVDEQPPIEV